MVGGLVVINEATAYRYFPDKNELLIAIIEKMKNELMGPIREIFGSEDQPEVRLKRIVTYHLQFVNEKDGLPIVFMNEIASGNDKVLVHHIRDILEEYQQILENVVSEILGINSKPSVQEFSTLFIGMATAMAIQRRLGISNKAHEDMANSLLPFIIKSIGGHNSHQKEIE
jgi:AcrR family transcriptional regulator